MRQREPSALYPCWQYPRESEDILHDLREDKLESTAQMETWRPVLCTGMSAFETAAVIRNGMLAPIQPGSLYPVCANS